MREESIKLTCDHCRAVHIHTSNDHAEPWVEFDIDVGGRGGLRIMPVNRMDLCPACAAEWKGVVQKFFADALNRSLKNGGEE